MDGENCKCEARCEYDCSCNVDWTSKETHDLRAEVECLRELLQEVLG